MAIPILPVAALVLALLSMPCAFADTWPGSVEMDGAVRRVHNPATPRHGTVDLHPEELWRLDGDDEEVVFGLIGDAVADAEGTVYLLDVQLKEVDIVDREGCIRARVGREGEGPGEFVRPRAVLVDSAGRVCVVQNVPAKIVMLSSDGEPLGDHWLPEYSHGGRLILRGARLVAGRLYLLLLSRGIDDQGNSDDHNALVSVRTEGEGQIRYLERVLHRAFDNAHYTEQEMSRVAPWKWTVGPAGRVFSNGVYDDYEILVHDADGELVQVVQREYEAFPRPDWHVEELQEYYDKRFAGRTRRGFPMSYEVSPYDPHIEMLFAREDGTLWVLPSRGAYDNPDGVLAIFDVFDRDGIFDQQVVVHGEGDYFHDSFLLSRGMLIVVRNTRIDLSAGAGDGNTSEREYEVIGYRLE